MNVLLLKCGLPHDTVIVCVRPGQYPLKRDDPTFSSPEAAFLLVEVFYYVPNVTHPEAFGLRWSETWGPWERD